jgi:ATP-dependent RNA helicase SUPV3L1/SUV3
VELAEGDKVLVEGEAIGHLEGFRFVVDATASHADRKLLLAAAEKHLPDLLARKADLLVARDLGALELSGGAIVRDGKAIATVTPGRNGGQASLALTRELAALQEGRRKELVEALELWLEAQLKPLMPLRELERAARDRASGSEVRALLLAVIAGHGIVPRDAAGLEHIPPEGRKLLRRLGVTIGALDIFVPALLKPAPRRLLAALGLDRRPQASGMAPVLAAPHPLPAGYRRAGKQAIRVDLAERILRAVHERRTNVRGGRFTPDRAMAISMGLAPPSFDALMRDAGFRLERRAQALPEGAHGPAAPESWSWRPRRRKPQIEGRNGPALRQGNAFAVLADLVR